MIKFRTIWVGFILGALVAALPGCELAYFFAGNGAQKAAFKVPKDDRVVVLVDSSSANEMSISTVSNFINAINRQLYAYRVTKSLVPAYQVIGLQRRDPMRYQHMGVADIVRTLHADLAIYVFVNRFDVQSISTGQVTRGNAEVLVKVVDRTGRRLWPLGAAPGKPITARVDPNYAMTQTPAIVENILISQLAVDVGRLFYAHEAHTRPGENP